MRAGGGARGTFYLDNVQRWHLIEHLIHYGSFLMSICTPAVAPAVLLTIRVQLSAAVGAPEGAIFP